MRNRRAGSGRAAQAPLRAFEAGLSGSRPAICADAGNKASAAPAARAASLSHGQIAMPTYRWLIEFVIPAAQQIVQAKLRRCRARRAASRLIVPFQPRTPSLDCAQQAGPHGHSDGCRSEFSSAPQTIANRFDVAVNASLDVSQPRCGKIDVSVSSSVASSSESARSCETAYADIRDMKAPEMRHAIVADRGIRAPRNRPSPSSSKPRLRP